MAYNKMRRATYKSSHSLSEKRSTFNASWCLKLSIVTGSQPVRTPLHLGWIMESSLMSVRDLWYCSKYSQHFSHHFFQNTSGFQVLAYSIHINFNQILCSSFMLKSISYNNYIITKKACPLFSKFKIDNWERGWSQVTYMNTKTPANQF